MYSIILQGRINDSTLIHAENAKKYSDDVIVSTWITVDRCELALHEALKSQGVRLVLTTDPGSVIAYEESGTKKTLNVNRQMCGTSAGLGIARYRYCIKTRTDLSINFDIFFKRWMESGRPFASLNITSVAPRRLFSPPFLFHISDWCIGGETKTFLKQYSRIINENEFIRSRSYIHKNQRWHVRLAAEQILAGILTVENELFKGKNQPHIKKYAQSDWDLDERVKSKFANITRSGIDFSSSKYRARANQWQMHDDLYFRDDHMLKPNIFQFSFYLCARAFEKFNKLFES